MINHQGILLLRHHYDGDSLHLMKKKHHISNGTSLQW